MATPVSDPELASAASPVEAAADAATNADADPELGQVIDGRYRIVAALGTGGMGAVYRAEHLGMGKHVAVKLLHAHISARRDASSRFRREAFAGGKLDHPNCVAATDFGVRDDGSFYLVMELLVGEPLRDVMDREARVPWPRALGIARHVLRGLAYAHGQGIVHRDIKPENVFLCRHDDDPEFAKILDFGIAKLIGAEAADMSTVTQAGMTVGTPTYLSPEQAFGGKIGPASDLYSLSVVLFEMLAGRPPFDDEEPVQLLTAHATRAVPRLDDVAPGAGVPPAVEALLRRGLAKTAAERFASADEFVMEIDRVRAGVGPLAARAATMGPFPTLGAAPPGAVVHPGVMTPAPPGFADASAPVARYATPLPGVPAGAAPTQGPFAALPPRRSWLGWGVAAILTVGVIAAIAAGGGPSKGAAGPTPSPAGLGGSTLGSSGVGSAARGGHPAVAPVPVPVPVPMPSTGGGGLDQLDADVRLKAALLDLEQGATCAERKKAVAALRALGDARAIAPLKRARYRMRGGVLGIGDKNTNACLKADADAAIAALGGK